MTGKKPDRYISAQPLAGERLPADWKNMAPKRAALAEASYLWKLQNAWRGNGQPLNVIQQAGLSNDQSMPEQIAKQARLTGPPSWEEMFGQK